MNTFKKSLSLFLSVLAILSVMACATPGGGSKSKVAVYSYSETAYGITYRAEVNFYSDGTFDGYMIEGNQKELWVEGTYSGDPSKDGTIILKVEGQPLSVTVVNGKVNFAGMELTRENLPSGTPGGKTVLCKFYAESTVNGVYAKNEFVFYSDNTYDLNKYEGSVSGLFYSGTYTGDPTKDGRITVIIEGESFPVMITDGKVNLMGITYIREGSEGAKTWSLNLKNLSRVVTSSKNLYVAETEYDAFIDLYSVIPVSSLKVGDKVEINYSVTSSANMGWVGAFLIDNSQAADGWMNLADSISFLSGKSTSGKITFEVKTAPKGSVVLQLYYKDIDAPVTFTFN